MRNIVNALLLRQGSVLLARRSPHPKAYPGLWSFPGRHVQAGETLEQALIRLQPRQLRAEVGDAKDSGALLADQKERLIMIGARSSAKDAT